MKLVVNQATENMGLRTTQLMGSASDGMLSERPGSKPETHRVVTNR